ncbi:MAG: ParB N-terminal domain-containing protein [Bacteroidota bacterium]
MIHKESENKIYRTISYGKFKLIKGNRELSQKKINKIVKSVNNGNNLLQHCPIIVDEGMSIVDGQHRFSACVKLNHEVFYVITKSSSGLVDIADLNSNTDKWANKDFIACFCDTGKQDYIKLREFLDKYGFPLSTSLQLLSSGPAASNGGGKVIEQFRNGTFRITNYDFAKGVAEKVIDYKSFSESSKSGHFVLAIAKLIGSDKYNHAQVINKLSKHNLVVEARRTTKDYILHLEELFNYKNQKRITIF